MQRTANLITALTALALAVAFVAGLSFQTQRTDAAAATIAALNVGTCHTTDLSVLNKDDCNPHYQTFEFNRQGQDQAFEVDELYATYAFDPKTADRMPRGILKDADLLKISIEDTGRDVRRGVLLISSDNAETMAHPGTPPERLKLNTVVDPSLDDPKGDGTTTPTPNAENGPVTQLGGVVAAAISRYTFNDETKDVPEVEKGFTFRRTDADSGTGPVTINTPGIVELLFEPVSGEFDTFKPIAKGGNERGEMKFFGKVANSSASVDDQEFIDLEDYLDWDEDVVSGTDDQAPAISAQVNLTSDETITLRAIWYLTSQVEYMIGGDGCVPEQGIPDDESTTTVDEEREKGEQADCTDDELGDDPSDYDKFVLHASSVDGEIERNVYLRETGRFTGVFQGFVRLTDQDGDGGLYDDKGERSSSAVRSNWGRVIKHAANHAAQTSHPDESTTSYELRFHQYPGAAVIGVETQPVTITYKDTDGDTNTFSVTVDISPPSIDVTGPMHNDRNDDREINFSGSVNDNASGLAENSFALYVDHTRDENEATPGSLNLPVDGVMKREVQDVNEDGTPLTVDLAIALGAVNAATTAKIDVPSDYMGYADDKPTFGVVDHRLIYPLNDPAGSRGAVDQPFAETRRKGIEAEEFNNGDADAIFRDNITINFLAAQGSTSDRDVPYNHPIDFHAVVRDVAGNIGFSDSDETEPRLINDLGTEEAKRLGKDDPTTGISNGMLPNVLGVYSRHIVYIDNVDPEIDEERTVTGFYDVDGDKKPIVDRAGVMVVFDGPVDPRSISAGTFLLTMGEDEDKETLPIVEAKVEGKLVFLKLADELVSDAKPLLTIADGEEVRDKAGRVTRSDELKDPVKVRDGNLPVFTVTLAEGSGLGTDDEGPTRLTNKTIKVLITSDERIQGSPKVSVVCSNLIYPGAEEGDDDRGVADYVSGVTGASKDTVTGGLENGDCGRIDADKAFTLRTAVSTRRTGNRWEYTWRQGTGDARVPEGLATVVVFGNDRSDYKKYNTDDTIRNWGSETAEYRFDSVFRSPLDTNSGGRVLPAKDSDVAERRPFVMLDFSGEPTTVSVTEMTVDGMDVSDSLDNRGRNRFLYWPETLSSGEHEVKFSAQDAANNKVENESFKFNVTTRDAFILSLFAGWNAISFPADPKASSLDDIFGESAVDRVIGWIPSSTTGPWAIATKADGQWMSSVDTANLTDMKAQYGYWVHSTEFIDISVELRGPIDRETGEVPTLTGVPTYPGWNFVGVVDQDGDQTEGRAGANLKDGIMNVAGEDPVGEQDDIEVRDYLAGFARAYRWDVITNSYQVLTGSDNVRIGEGIWVYFDEGIAP